MIIKQLMLEAFNLVEPKKQKLNLRKNVIDYMKKQLDAKRSIVVCRCDAGKSN